tara:strand:+ start:886 stop:1191 length:306 start_codon:yes stop_codon:yes gene_type:complete
MNRLLIFFLIFVFVISTAIIKNSSKKIEEKIYKKKENLAILKNKYDLVILEFDFLNSPDEIQKKVEQYFIKDEFSSIDISKLKIAEIKNNKIEFNSFLTND